MIDSNILIIGAGAAGLMAASELAKAGKRVVVLEARSRIGGRINTQRGNGFSMPIEGGAEFVHGSLPLTQALLTQMNISLLPMAGRSYQVKKGVLQEAEEFIDDFDMLLTRLKELKKDMPFAEFLAQYLNAEEFTELRESVTRFAEGYDAADIQKASSFALREEWLIDGAANSYHPQGGYSQVVNYLANEFKAAGGIVHLATVVKQINWQAGWVEVICEGEKRFVAHKALVTVPLGVLQASPPDLGFIRFNPELPEKRAAFQAMGFGPIIKVVLEFKESFWGGENAGKVPARQAPDLAFLFADTALFNAWWTQLPDKTPLLTGWLAGPKAEEFYNSSDNELVTRALESLALIFNTNTAFLESRLHAQQVFNWASDPFARGAYAYATVASAAALQEVAQPVADSLYFAGEAFYEGPAMGTVEAALVSGAEAAKIMLRTIY